MFDANKLKDTMSELDDSTVIAIMNEALEDGG